MNLPNKLSLLRIILVPAMAVLFILGGNLFTALAVAVFLLAAFTDFLDGYIARKHNMVTDLGKLLDPIADKLLVLFALFLVIEAGLLPLGVGSICGGLMIGRDFVISIVRQIAASKNVIIMANIYGKLKAIFQYISLPLLMCTRLDFLTGLLFDIVKYSAYSIFFIAVALSVISGAVYVIQNRKVFYAEQ